MNQGAVPYEPERFHPDRLAAVLSDPARLDVVRRTGLMGSAPEEAFDRWAALAARALRTPVALVTLFDDEHQYLKSVIGLEGVAGVSRAARAGDLPVRDRRRPRAGRRRHARCTRSWPGSPGRCATGWSPTPARRSRVDGQHVGSLCVCAARAARVDAGRRRAARRGRRGDRVGDLAARRRRRPARRQRRRRRPQPHPRADRRRRAAGDILREVVLSIEDFDPTLRGSVLLLDPILRTIHNGAAPSLPASYSAQLEGLVIGPDVGSCGTAAYYGTEILSPDIETDPKWAAFLPLTREHGLKLVLVVPDPRRRRRRARDVRPLRPTSRASRPSATASSSATPPASPGSRSSASARPRSSSTAPRTTR